MWHTAKWKSICCELILQGEREWAAGSKLYWTASANRVSLLTQSVAPSGLRSAAMSSDFYTQVFMKSVCNHILPLAFFHSSLFFFLEFSSEATQCFNRPSHYCLAVAMIVDCLLISECLEVLMGHLILNCPRLFSFHPSQCLLNSRNVHLPAPQHLHSTEMRDLFVCTSQLQRRLCTASVFRELQLRKPFHLYSSLLFSSTLFNSSVTDYICNLKRN